MYLKNIKYLLFIISYLTLTNSCRELSGTNDPGLLEPNITSPGYITVTIPEYGETYTRGDTINIKWIGSSWINKVDIMLFRKNELKRIIVEGVENSWSYLWIIPESTNHSVHYRIKLQDHHYYSISDFSDQFEITD